MIGCVTSPGPWRPLANGSTASCCSTALCCWPATMNFHCFFDAPAWLLGPGYGGSERVAYLISGLNDWRSRPTLAVSTKMPLPDLIRGVEWYRLPFHFNPFCHLVGASFTGARGTVRNTNWSNVDVHGIFNAVLTINRKYLFSLQTFHVDDAQTAIT